MGQADGSSRLRPERGVCAFNQGSGRQSGTYNGFLAAGLIYGLVAGSLSFKVFFLVCVLIAGLFGALTASRRILFVQALPAALALLAVFVKV